jgi:hypothetical protein
MTVYVDRTHNLLGRMVTSHMIADTLEELHAMARAIGILKLWYQPLSSPHYNLNRTRRAKALALGAINADRKTIVGVIRCNRAKGIADGTANRPNRK